jgi:hypothetical protein
VDGTHFSDGGDEGVGNNLRLLFSRQMGIILKSNHTTTIRPVRWENVQCAGLYRHLNHLKDKVGTFAQKVGTPAQVEICIIERPITHSLHIL